MSDTKERIMEAALRLFARGGYKEVTTDAIAAELGMVKSALYKHYKSKRDIFDSILEKMRTYDADISNENGMPEYKYKDMPDDYKGISIDSVKKFTMSQFKFWTENELAVCYRRMLTIEQYKSKETADLYNASFLCGPVAYMEDIFKTMMEEHIIKEENPKQLALEFYAPLGFLIHLSDAAENTPELEAMLQNHMETFFERTERHD